MHTNTRLSARIIITAALAGAVALVSACAIDPTQNPQSGPTGSIGTECRCSTGQADCDGEDGQCQSGLVCRRVDNGQQICTHDCGSAGLLTCPINYACKALGISGGRLYCVPQT
ncbi:MAG: hypothetical protein U0270_26150 [Labilithrix sp.]